MKLSRVLPLLTAICSLTTIAHGAVLMLDFGPTTVTGAGPLVNSPYHTASGGAFTQTGWYKVQTADIGSGLFYADSTVDNSLSLNLGATGDNTSTTINLANQPDSSNALGTSTNAGIYATPSVGMDGIFEATQFDTRRVGFQLSGLAAGTYDIFVTARNTNANTSLYTQTVFAGAGGTTGNFDYAGYGAATLSFEGDNAASTSWVENTNYVKLTVTLTAGQVLNLAVAGGGGQTRGFLNSVQIVAVPEPGATGFLGLGALALLGIARRRIAR